MRGCIYSTFLREVAFYFLTVLSVAFFFLSPTAFSGTLTEYRYDATGNIIAIDHSGTTLSLFSFSPISGPVGEQVTIYGSSFSPNAADNTVTFNGTRASVLQAFRASLLVQVPADATTGPISVTAGGHTVTSASLFTVTTQHPAPEIESLTPSCGAPGTIIKVKGKYFDQPLGEKHIKLGALLIDADVQSPQELTFIVPANAISGQLNFINGDKENLQKNYFLVPPTNVYGVSCADFSNKDSITSIALGESKKVTVTAGHKSAVFFDVRENDFLRIDFSEFLTTPLGKAISYRLYDNRGVMLLSNWPDGTGTQHLPFAKNEGTYFLILLSPDSTGDASVMLSLQSDPILHPENNSNAVIQTLLPGTTARVGFQAETEESFGFALSQLQYSVMGGGSTLITLIDPDGKSYSASRYLYNYAYCVIGSACDLNISIIPKPGMYSIYFQPPKNTTIQGKAWLSTNVQEELSLGQPFHLQLDRLGENGWLTFEAEKGQTLMLTFTDLVKEAGSNINVTVLQPDGDWTLHGETTVHNNSSLKLNVTASGSYKIRVDPTAAGTASMTMTLTAQ